MHWNKDRFEEICGLLRPFLIQSGLGADKTWFVPVGALSGVNLVNRTSSDSKLLVSWYKGPTLVDLLGEISRVILSFIFNADDKINLSHPIDQSQILCDSQYQMYSEVLKEAPLCQGGFLVAYYRLESVSVFYPEMKVL